jgi:hypothetical protein
MNVPVISTSVLHVVISTMLVEHMMPVYKLLTLVLIVPFVHALKLSLGLEQLQMG